MIEKQFNGYSMGIVLIKYCEPIYYQYQYLSQDVFNYPMYEKYLYAMVECVKESNHYLISGYYHIYRPSSLIIYLVKEKVSSTSSLQLDGIPSTILFSNKVQEGYK